LLLFQRFESFRIIREFIARVCCGGIPQQDALHLAREGGRELWVIAHDVVIRGVPDEDKFSVWECLEDFVEKGFTNGECLVYCRKVKGTGVKGAEGVGFINKVHVDTCGLLWGCS